MNVTKIPTSEEFEEILLKKDAKLKELLPVHIGIAETIICGISDQMYKGNRHYEYVRVIPYELFDKTPQEKINKICEDIEENFEREGHSLYKEYSSIVEEVKYRWGFLKTKIYTLVIVYTW